MRTFLIISLALTTSLCFAQPQGYLELKGDFTAQDSIDVSEAFVNAYYAVEEMHKAMHKIWDVGPEHGQHKRKLRKARWLGDSAYVKWLGPPNKLRMVHRRIERLHRKFNNKFTLEVTKENKSRCRGWISAWTIPYGQVRIRLCDDFFRYRTHLHEKIIVHELGHETGMLFHRRIHGCRAALKAAKSKRNKLAKRSPENYAWLAMTYFNLSCGY